MLPFLNLPPISFHNSKPSPKCPPLRTWATTTTDRNQTCTSQKRVYKPKHSTHPSLTVTLSWQTCTLSPWSNSWESAKIPILFCIIRSTKTPGLRLRTQRSLALLPDSRALMPILRRGSSQKSLVWTRTWIHSRFPILSPIKICEGWAKNPRFSSTRSCRKKEQNYTPDKSTPDSQPTPWEPKKARVEPGV